MIWSPQKLSAISEQVAAAPKKKPRKETTGEAEKVEPKTMSEEVEDILPDVLKSAGVSRQQAIKLTNIPYAGDLSKNLLDHAGDLEDVFKKMRAAKDDNNENLMRKLFAQLKQKEEFGDKAKAWHACTFITLGISLVHLRLYKANILLAGG